MTYNSKFEFVGVEIIKFRSGYWASEVEFEEKILDQYMLFNEDGDSWRGIWDVIARVPEERNERFKDYPQLTVVEPFYLFNFTFLGNGSDDEGGSAVQCELEREQEWATEADPDTFQKTLPALLAYATANITPQLGYKGEHYYLTSIWKQWGRLDDEGYADDGGIELVGYVDYDKLMEAVLKKVIKPEIADVVENVVE